MIDPNILINASQLLTEQNQVYCQQLFTDISSIYFRNIFLFVCGMIILSEIVNLLSKKYNLKYNPNKTKLIYILLSVTTMYNFDLNQWYYIAFFSLGSFIVFYEELDNYSDRVIRIFYKDWKN